jgi:hypothetical protein
LVRECGGEPSSPSLFFLLANTEKKRAYVITTTQICFDESFLRFENNPLTNQHDKILVSKFVKYSKSMMRKIKYSKFKK